MKYIQLYKDGKELLGSDGVMKVDGRYSIHSIIREVKDKNKKLEKNFPHHVATSFAICKGRMWSNPSKQISIN